MLHNSALTAACADPSVRLTKDFRNLIHPGPPSTPAKTCDCGTALSLVAALDHVVRDLTPKTSVSGQPKARNSSSGNQALRGRTGNGLVQVVGSVYQRVRSPYRVKRWIIRPVAGRFRLYQRIWFGTGMGVASLQLGSHSESNLSRTERPPVGLTVALFRSVFSFLLQNAI
jgi:hypothetical protein